MQINPEAIRVCSILTAMTLTLQPGVYPRRTVSRHSDCFVYVRGGSAIYDFGAYRFEALPGDIIYLAWQSLYAMEVQPGYDVIFIDCMLDRPHREVWESARLPLLDGARVEQMFLLAARWWLPETRHASLMAESALLYMLAQLSKESGRQYVAPDHRKLLLTLPEYILTHLSDSELSCDALAHRCKLSPVHFRRIFLRFFGAPPSRYIASLRIRRAGELLLQGDMTIAQIARETGYRSAAYFSRAFRAETGLTPSQYRRQAF